MRGFLMNLEMAEKFFTLCEERQANTREEREALMLEFVHMENVKILKDEKVIMKELEGKRVVNVRKGGRNG